MRNIGKVIQSAVIEHHNWKQELYTFLRTYRATPHSSTGFSPYKALFGREPKTRLPMSLPSDNFADLDKFRATDELSRQRIQR